MSQHDLEPAQTPSTRTSVKATLHQSYREKGWRRSALLFALAALITFAINLAFTIWASINTVDGIVAEGSCANIKRLNTGLHVLINTLSTVVVAGGNYCMQCLSAPTRSQVDKAHRTRQWLDIGVSSFRNIVEGWRYGGGRWRVMLWLMLGASSFPLHLIYNSALYQSTSTNTYDIWLMHESFFTSNYTVGLKSDSSTNTTALPDLTTAFSHGALRRLDLPSCIAAYTAPFQSTHSHLILVSTLPIQSISTSTSNPFGKSTIVPTFSLDKHDTCGNIPAHQWVCNQYQPPGPFEECPVACDDDGLLPRVYEDAHKGAWMPVAWMPVDYCYSLPTGEHCKLRVSQRLLVVVMVMNLGQAGVMFAAVVFSWREGGSERQPLLTVGDAIASFVDRPDETTERMCLLTRDVAVREWWSRPDVERPLPAYRGRFDERRMRRWSAASMRRWSVTVLVLGAGVVVCLGLFAFGIRKIKGERNVVSLLRLGLGSIGTKTILRTSLTGGRGAGVMSVSDLKRWTAVANAVLASMPQLIFSLVYIAVNGICTTMSLAVEWSRFGLPDGSGRKGLRRSTTPKGEQRSGYKLQLPSRLALPLMVLCGLLHWLISQSFFVVYLENYTVDWKELALNWSSNEYSSSTWEHKDEYGPELITSGWSPAGVISAIVAAVLLFFLIVAFGSLPLPTGMPVAGSCSVAIAAACHPPRTKPEYSDDTGPLSEKRLQWGKIPSVRYEYNPEHCSFSAEEVSYPSIGGVYS